ncbi:scavenger receptor cysteine-rich domain-containing protein DMBT1-like [Branchiostoma floridae x Branchiostoma belcheri]
MAVLWVILHLMLVLSDGIAENDGNKEDRGNRKRYSWTTPFETTPLPTWDPLGCNSWDEFQCYDGRCYPRHRVCDGLPDCSSIEDEDLNYCSYRLTTEQYVTTTASTTWWWTTAWDNWWTTANTDYYHGASCNFDYGDCGYSKESSGIQWIRHRGSTPSSSTGPSGDHTTGRGYYMYIETSSSVAGAVARLRSPTISDIGWFCLQFAYHMYGTDIGELRVRVGSSIEWSRSNNQGNSWHLASVQVYIIYQKCCVQVVFEGVRGNSFRGDIAIDDVVLNPGSCPTGSTTTDDPWWWTTGSTTPGQSSWWTTLSTGSCSSEGCGVNAGGCWCDRVCASTNDCCHDYVEVCESSVEGASATDLPTVSPSWYTSQSGPPVVPCGGHFYQSSGVIDSPHYPNNYFNNANCRWTIIGSPGSTLEVVVERFQLESGYDYLNIYDGRFTSSPRLARLDGTGSWRYYYSSSNEVLIHFTSDGSVVDNGFRIRYQEYWGTQEPTTVPDSWWTTAWNNHSFQVRLRGGNGYSYGRVEVYYNGQWGTVCDDGFGWQEARVICRELGFSDYSTYYYRAYYGQGSGPIWMDNLNCNGYESSLQYCTHNGWGSHNCYHYEDVSVVCAAANGTDLPTITPPLQTSQPDLGISGSCDSDMMTVTFDLWVAPWLDGNFMHFVDPTCKAINNGSHLILATKLNECGTKKNETDAYVIYTNKVLMYSTNHSVIIRDLQLEVPVTCKLPRKSVVSAQFTADSNAVRYNLEREGQFDIALQFYRSSLFYSAHTGPVGLQLNERAYAQVRLSSDDNLRIRVDSCVATPSRNPTDTVIYSVIENNCPEDPTVRMYNTSLPNVERFGFRAFQFTTGQNKVYLHCVIQVCDGSDPNSQCTQGCMRRGDREKREATPSNQLRQVSAGPIFLRMSGDDEGVDFSAEKKTYTSSNFVQTPALTLAVAAVAGLAVVVLGIAAMAFVYKHRRDKMVFRYQPVDTAETY